MCRGSIGCPYENSTWFPSGSLTMQKYPTTGPAYTGGTTRMPARRPASAAAATSSGGGAGQARGWGVDGGGGRRGRGGGGWRIVVDLEQDEHETGLFGALAQPDHPQVAVVTVVDDVEPDGAAIKTDRTLRSRTPSARCVSTGFTADAQPRER